MWITLSCLAFLLFADQLTKYLCERFLSYVEVIKVIPNFLDITLVYNKGAAFSFMSNSTWLLALISLVASGFLVYFITKNNWKRKKCYSIAITLMLAGTFGNFIDRAFSVFKFREGVVDMIIFAPLDFIWERIFNSSFAIFNLADTYLVIGVILLAIDIMFFQEKRAENI